MSESTDRRSTLQREWFDAQFDGGGRRLTVGPFDSEGEAKEYGVANQRGELRFLGVAVRVGREELQKVAAVGQFREDAAAGADRRLGVVTRWPVGATSGFITDADRVSWFVSRDQLPADLDWLLVDTEVSFAGKRYPQAYSVVVQG